MYFVTMNLSLNCDAYAVFQRRYFLERYFLKLCLTVLSPFIEYFEFFKKIYCSSVGRPVPPIRLSGLRENTRRNEST